MSQKEMEALDREIEEKVNGKKGMDVGEAGIPQSPAATAPFRQGGQGADDREQMFRRMAMRRKILAAVWAVVCLLAAAALVVALYVPAALPWIVNVGVMCFVVAAAIIIDRGLRRWLV